MISLENNELLTDYRKNSDEILEDFITFLRFQSISTDPHYKPQINDCFNWLLKYLIDIGMDVQKWETPGHPTLFATHLKAGPNKPTLLLYSHYDVQPVDPLELWTTPPFEPEIRNGEVYARGAQDNKGQCFYILQALRFLLKKNQGTLPINIRWCIEGEEETGSSGLAQILKSKQADLKADYLAIVDVGLNHPQTPAVTLGVRGIVTMELEIEESTTDMHSGFSGGIIFNPIHALVDLLSKVRDPSGKILIPGFYDDVLELTSEEKDLINFNFDHDQFHKAFGAKAIGGEDDYSPYERAWVRPTFEINGISGGYTGTGFKTVIPAKATAKVSCRLVPNQDPKKIGKLVSDYLVKQTPKGLKLKVNIREGSGAGLRTSPNSKIVKAFSQAFEEIFNENCDFILCGGSIPITEQLAKVSGAEVVWVGLGLPDDCIHAPNEHFGLDRLEKGFLIITRVVDLLGNEKG